MPDEILIPDSSSNRTPHPLGQFPLLCCDVIDLGENLRSFPGKTAYVGRQMAFVYLTGERTPDGKPFTLSRRFAVSFDDRASLRKWLETWRGGKSFTPEEVAGKPKLSKLYGVAGYGSVADVAGADGKIRQQLTSIMPPPKIKVGTETVTPAVDPALLSEYTRANFWAEAKAKNAEEVAAHRAQQERATSPRAALTDALDLERLEGDDDLPF